MGGIYYESKSFHVLIIIVVLLLFVTGIVLLVRWVIRSTEKNQKNQYGQAPAMYSEQKAFCTGCGKELSACEEFCSVCGKQRTTPAQGAQPTFQQPVYPQMGYVQDAPSGGMTADCRLDSLFGMERPNAAQSTLRGERRVDWRHRMDGAEYSSRNSFGRHSHADCRLLFLNRRLSR